MNKKDMIKKIIEMFNTGDTNGVSSIFSLSYIDHQKPDFIKTDGPEEFKEIVRLARRSMPNLIVKMSKHDFRANKIVVEFIWRSKKGERKTKETLLVSNGKVEEHWGKEIK